MNQNNLLCSKPTLYLQELHKIVAPLEITDDFLGVHFLKALPNTIRPLLLANDSSTTLEELSRVADTLLDYGTNQSVSFLCDNNTSYSGKTSDWRQARGNSVQPRQNRGSDTDTTTQRSSIPDYSPSTIPIGICAFHESQRPKVCIYHMYYGNRAKSCKGWCILASSSLNV